MVEKSRALYIIKQFPQISETYVKSEIEAMSDKWKVLVVAYSKPDIPYSNPARHVIEKDWNRIVEVIQEFRPHVLHTHWLYNIWDLDWFATQTSTPYTVRAHSFDVLTDNASHYPTAVPLVNSDLCLGVLTFPFGRDSLIRTGMREDKIHSCWPVVNVARFMDMSPNGDRVMNVGACLPKKRMEDFLELAKSKEDTGFDLYALSYDAPKFRELNQSMGSPVTVVPAVEPNEMPAEYKRHRWLVYTASQKIGTVGWPMAIAEAQASGVGVCMANLRPDLKQYVGEAGYLFNSISEARDIISKPFPEEKRELGFEHAKKSDVAQHKLILDTLWNNAVAADRRMG